MSERPAEAVQFGRYQLMEKLATGGMAEIFKACTHGAHGFEKTFVVKRILPHLARDEEFVSMFIDEAKVMVQLNHPKVVQVLDFGQQDGQYFIVMEYIKGVDCLALLRSCAHMRYRPTTAIAVHVAAEVLDALDYAHNLTSSDGSVLGIVHRDVSPSNIFISELGEVKLGDFGIACSLSAKGMMGSKALKGKYGYMAPEAVSEGEVDHRADIFSVGIVLAELLMIRRLFIAKSELEVLLKVRDANLRRLDKYGKHIQPELRQILDSALSRDPSTRYQDAATFRDALHRYLFDNRLMVRANDVRLFLKRLQVQEDETQDMEAEAEAPPTPKPTPKPLQQAVKVPTDETGPQLAVREDETPQRPDTTLPYAAGAQPQRGDRQELPTKKLPTVEREVPVVIRETRPSSSTEYRSETGERVEIKAPLNVEPLAPGVQRARERDKKLEELVLPSDALKQMTGQKVVGKRRRIALGPPPKPKPVPTVLAETGESPRLKTEDALAAVPEVEDSSGSSSRGADFRTPLTDDSQPALLAMDAEEMDTPLEAGVMAASTISSQMEPIQPPDKSGDLEDYSLVKVLFELAVDEETGLLVIYSGELVKEIYLVDGDPQFVASNQPGELFGQYLVSKGAISEGELSMALAMLPHFEGKLGNALVALKLLRPMQVLRHLTHQVRQKLLNAFTLEDGTFAFFSGRSTEREAASLGLDAFEIIGAGVRAMPWELLARRSKALRGSYLTAVSPSPVPPEVFRMGGREREIYNKLDGRFTIQELLDRYDDEEQRQFFERVVYLLGQAGLAVTNLPF